MFQLEQQIKRLEITLDVYNGTLPEEYLALLEETKTEQQTQPPKPVPNVVTR